VGPAAHLIPEVAVTYVDVNGLATWHEVRGEGFLRGEYDRVSPDGPEHFPVVYAKTLRMIAVEAPTLVLQGDRDEVTLEHGAAVAAALPQGRLAVLPGTHALPVENPEVVNTLLVWFLAGAVPAVDWFAPGPSR
jgi:pimeloyl-ACP methyl ester carboxylesterase